MVKIFEDQPFDLSLDLGSLGEGLVERMGGSGPNFRADFGRGPQFGGFGSGPAFTGFNTPAPAFGGFAAPGPLFNPGFMPMPKPGQPKTETGPTGTASPTASGSSGLGSDRWADAINQAASAHGDVPDLAEVMQAVMELESGGKMDAEGVVVTEGPYAGQRAQCAMQIMPGNYPGVNLKDPTTCLQKGAEMLASRYKTYGNWDKAIAAYFGAIDENGNITGAKDDNGTSGYTYVAIVNAHRQKIRASRQATQATAAANPQRAQKVLDAGAALLGSPYELGGRRANGRVAPGVGIDCSEFTAYAYEQVGVKLPWNAQMQYNATKRVEQGQLQAGDLVFFQGTYDVGNGDVITHVGIYVGNGRFINSASGGVQYADLNSEYWKKRYAGAGRVA